MQVKRFKPHFDKLYWLIFVPTELLVLATAIVPAIFEPKTLFWTVPVLVFVSYFLISPFFGYVELRESTLFIKYGLILKKEIPYGKIRKLERGKSVISDCMMSLKTALYHVNIKYNIFDVTCVSVKDNDSFIEELKKRL